MPETQRQRDLKSRCLCSLKPTVICHLSLVNHHASTMDVIPEGRVTNDRIKKVGRPAILP